MLKILNKKEV